MSRQRRNVGPGRSFVLTRERVLWGETHPVGTVVFPCLGHDYGLASDDARATGEPHVSVTLDPDGGYPLFTVPSADLEPADPAGIEGFDYPVPRR